MSIFAYDAVVVGSGPNGLAAAIALQQAGLAVLLLEGKSELGGLRTAELTLPGFHHYVCSAIHPLAAASPFFQTLPLARYGLRYIAPPVAVAHPFDDGSAATVRSLAGLIPGAGAWRGQGGRKVSARAGGLHTQPDGPAPTSSKRPAGR